MFLLVLLHLMQSKCKNTNSCLAEEREARGKGRKGWFGATALLPLSRHGNDYAVCILMTTNKNTSEGYRQKLRWGKG